MHKIAIYPGTFDPITNGHLDIIKRCVGIFDTVIVAVAKNESKNPMFSLAQRLEMIALALDSLRGVEVEGFDCLLAEFARQKGSNVLIRGLRAVSDFEYEFQMALTNFIQMVLPVPAIFIIALALSFSLDMEMGFILLGVVVAVLVLAFFIMQSAAPLFKKLQKLLDRMTTVLLENLTGVQVVRAFNSEKREERRMGIAFSKYANTSIKANRRFANLDGLSFLLRKCSFRH